MIDMARAMEQVRQGPRVGAEALYSDRIGSEDVWSGELLRCTMDVAALEAISTGGWTVETLDDRIAGICQQHVSVFDDWPDSGKAS